MLAKWGVTASGVSADSGPQDWEELLVPGKTKVFYVEAITNPLTQVGRWVRQLPLLIKPVRIPRACTLNRGYHIPVSVFNCFQYVQVSKPLPPSGDGPARRRGLCPAPRPHQRHRRCAAHCQQQQAARASCCPGLQLPRLLAPLEYAGPPHPAFARCAVTHSRALQFRPHLQLQLPLLRLSTCGPWTWALTWSATGAAAQLAPLTSVDDPGLPLSACPRAPQSQQTPLPVRTHACTQTQHAHMISSPQRHQVPQRPQRCDRWRRGWPRRQDDRRHPGNCQRPGVSPAAALELQLAPATLPAAS